MIVECERKVRKNRVCLYFRMSKDEGQKDLVSTIDDIINEKERENKTDRNQERKATKPRFKRVGQFPEDTSGDSTPSSSSSSSSSSDESSMETSGEDSPKPSTSKQDPKPKTKKSKKKGKKGRAMEKKKNELRLMKEKLEVMEKMMEMQEKMKKTQKEAKKREKKETQDVLLIQISEEERFEDDEVLEPKKEIEDARMKIEEKKKKNQEQIMESLKVTIHQNPKRERKEEEKEQKEVHPKRDNKRDQGAQTPKSVLERHPNEVIARRLLDRVGDVHWRHFPGINSITDFNCEPCMKFNREECELAHPHKEGGRLVRDICEICRFAAAVNNHHRAEDCDLESKLDSFVARKKRQEREQHNQKHMRERQGDKEAKKRKGDNQQRNR